MNLIGVALMYDRHQRRSSTRRRDPELRVLMRAGRHSARSITSTLPLSAGGGKTELGDKFAVARRWKSLGEYIGEVGVGVNIHGGDVTAFDGITAKMMPDRDVFGPHVEVPILREGEGGLIVDV